MKTSIDRREFLSRSAGAASLACLSNSILAATARATAVKLRDPTPPVARIQVVKDTYFGETLSDPYRWMENDKDPQWLPYLKGQNAYARSVLDALPKRDALLKRIQQLSGDTVSTSRVKRAGGLTFFTQRTLGADNYRLFVRTGLHGADRVLIDPIAQSSRTSHISLDWWQPSPDGKHVVYGISKDGSEDSVLHILRVVDGKDLPEQIPNTEGAHPSWLDDGSSFFYNQLTAPVNTPERYLDSQARLHRLGTDPNTDLILMKRGLVPGIEFDRIQSPVILTSRGAKYAALLLIDVRREARVYTAALADVVAGSARWLPAAAFEDEATDFELDGEDLYLLINKDSPRGRLVKTSASAPDLASAKVMVPQGRFVMESISRARDGFYLKLLDGGISRLQRLTREGRVTDIALPFDGTITALYASEDEDGTLMSLTGWLNPSAVYSVDTAGAITDTGLNPKPDIDLSGYDTRRLFATAKDGVKIPYVVIFRKGLQLNGSNPTWISAYGSYGAAAYTPAFNSRILALADAGAVVGYAYVRGGGEYGREWHKAGQLQNKPNTWRDLIAVCEDLITLRYTSPAQLAIGGRSAGGITVGRAMTERPDLFAAVIDGVGWSNPLRYVVEQNGFGEEPEWGAISDPAGYKALKSIDSYQAVKDGVRYPAVMLTTGVTDPRVAPFHVAKMTARLQAATASGKPILLRVDFDAGHGMGSTRAQQDREAADTYAFLLWQLKSGAQ